MVETVDQTRGIGSRPNRDVEVLSSGTKVGTRRRETITVSGVFLGQFRPQCGSVRTQTWEVSEGSVGIIFDLSGVTGYSRTY